MFYKFSLLNIGWMSNSAVPLQNMCKLIHCCDAGLKCQAHLHKFQRAWKPLRSSGRETVALTPRNPIPGFSDLSTKIHTTTTTERNPINPSQVRNHTFPWCSRPISPLRRMCQGWLCLLLTSIFKFLPAALSFGFNNLLLFKPVCVLAFECLISNLVSAWVLTAPFLLTLFSPKRFFKEQQE